MAIQRPLNGLINCRFERQFLFVWQSPQPAARKDEGEAPDLGKTIRRATLHPIRCFAAKNGSAKKWLDRADDAGQTGRDHLSFC
jgi:hypothetical protein